MNEDVDWLAITESLRAPADPEADRSIAEHLVPALTQYEDAHKDDPQANVWDDVIWAQAGKHIDEEATQTADPGYASKIAIFDDGSAVVWLEDERRWVAEVPQ